MKNTETQHKVVKMALTQSRNRLGSLAKTIEGMKINEEAVEMPDQVLHASVFNTMKRRGIKIATRMVNGVRYIWRVS
jgi:hypothetical protein